MDELEVIKEYQRAVNEKLILHGFPEAALLDRLAATVYWYYGHSVDYTVYESESYYQAELKSR